jgi:hypothetical protein
MNRSQRIAILVGFCVVGLILLVPPWKYVQLRNRGDKYYLERDAGYSFVFDPPSVKDTEAIREAFSIPQATTGGKPVEIYESYYEIHLDTNRLLVQCAVVLFVTLGLVSFFHRKQSPSAKEGA